MPDPCPLPSVTGRTVFVHSLRLWWPELWHGLNVEVWRRGAPLKEWAEKQGLGIVDTWLVDALAQTVAYWEAFPGSPDAELAADARWFFYCSPTECPEFKPTFEAPYPKYHFPGGLAAVLAEVQVATTVEAQRAVVAKLKLEPLDAFENRIRAQFETQIRAYLRQIRQAWVYDSKPELVTHAAWTALVLSGVSIAKISEAEEWANRFRRGEPQSTVGKAVKRFAAYIGLTLQRRQMHPKSGADSF